MFGFINFCLTPLGALALHLNGCFLILSQAGCGVDKELQLKHRPVGHWRARKGRGASLLALCLSVLPLLRSITSSLAPGALQGDSPGDFPLQLIV